MSSFQTLLLNKQLLGSHCSSVLCNTWAPSLMIWSCQGQNLHAHTPCEHEIIRRIFLSTKAFPFFTAQHTPAAVESIACQRLTKPQSWYELSPLCSKDRDKGREKKMLYPLICYRVGYSWIITSLGDSQQSAGMVKLMYEGEVQTEQ